MRFNQPAIAILKLWMGICLLLLGTLQSVSAANVPNKDIDFNSPTLEPLPAQERAVKEIIRQLEYAHYRKQSIDDKLSSAILDNYIEFLDSQKLYFTRQDLEDFERYRYTLDKAIKSAELKPAFDIYNRFQQRVVERQQFALELLDKGIDKLDFNKTERLILDRESQPWAKDIAELKDLWRLRLKNSILNQRLSDKTDEEISSMLTKRFQSQVKRIQQAKSEDAFQVFMNVVTNLYDPHTQYMSPRNSENFKISMSLSLEGIGAVLQTDDEFTKVVRLISEGPADKQGQLRPADRIVGVGQGKEGEIVDVVGWRLEDVVSLIRGAPRTLVKLEVIPAKAKSEADTDLIQIVRDRVELEDQSAKYDVIELDRDNRKYSIGVIELPTFYADFDAMSRGDPNYKSTTRDVADIVKKLKTNHQIDGLVVDLRDNGGGSLTEAIQLTGLFIDQGPAVQVRGLNNMVRVFDDNDEGVAYTGPLAVLVNRMSASASEIFAAAIQDYGRGVVIGDQTFGKGTVQSVKPLSHGHLKITEAKFYRISGGSTQHKGVIPDILLPSPVDKTEIGEDALEEALPWDQINSVAHRKYGNFDLLLGEVQKSHQNRMEKHPEYQALLKEIDFINAVKQQKAVSLNTEARKAELEDLRKEELAYVNLRREAKDKPVFESYEAYETYLEEQAATTNNDEELDFVAKESGEILVDILQTSPMVADNNS